MEINNRAFSKIWIIGILAVLLAGGFFAWQYWVPKPAPADETADWKTYRNEQYGFEFKYPASIDISYEGKTEFSLQPLRVDFGFFEVTVWDNPGSKAIKDYFLELACVQNKPICEYFDQGYSLEKSVNIGGGIFGWTTSVGVKSQFFVVLSNSEFFLGFLNRWPDDAEKTKVFNQIFSTFRFLLPK